MDDERDWTWPIIFGLLLLFLFVATCTSVPKVSYFVVEQRECIATTEVSFQEANWEGTGYADVCIRWGPSSRYYQKYPYRQVNTDHLTFFPSGTIVIAQEYRHLYTPIEKE